MTGRDPYVCEHCGARRVVPSLARDCERAHEADDGQSSGRR